jgi:hypothetical protein
MKHPSWKILVTVYVCSALKIKSKPLSVWPPNKDEEEEDGGNVAFALCSVLCGFTGLTSSEIYKSIIW